MNRLAKALHSDVADRARERWRWAAMRRYPQDIGVHYSPFAQSPNSFSDFTETK